MKTTLDIPDPLIRQIKACSALNGQPMKMFFIEAVKAKLEAETGRPSSAQAPVWMQHFGAFKKQAGAIRQVQATIDAECSHIDPEDWK